MKYQEAVEYLSKELLAKPVQIKGSLGRTSALKNINEKEATFEIKEDDPNDYIGVCGGKIPFKLYHVNVTEGNRKKQTTIYCHRMIINGKEKVSVTTSPEKESRGSIWTDLEGRVI